MSPWLYKEWPLWQAGDILTQSVSVSSAPSLSSLLLCSERAAPRRSWDDYARTAAAACKQVASATSEATWLTVVAHKAHAPGTGENCVGHSDSACHLPELRYTSHHSCDRFKRGYDLSPSAR